MRRRRRVYLVRHGDVTYFDPSGNPYSQTAVPLTEDGEEQCRLLGAELRGLPIDRWVSSGLVRTRQTLELLTDSQDLPVEVCPELEEIVPGNLAELSEVRDAAQDFADAFGRSVDRDARFLGGERFGDFEARVLAAFQSLVEGAEWSEMLVAAHGATNRVILLHALGADLGALHALEQDPACLNVLDIDPDGRQIVRLVNFTPYDVGKRELRATTLERIYLKHLHSDDAAEHA